jgi:putative flippase GtrA
MRMNSSFLRFLGVGVINTALYFGLVYVFSTVLRFGHLLAVSVAFGLCMTYQFTANKIFSFRSRGDWRSEALRYIGMTAVTYAVTVGIVYVVVEVLGLRFWFGVFAAAGAAALTGYAIARYWVYA